MHFLESALLVVGLVVGLSRDRGLNPNSIDLFLQLLFLTGNAIARVQSLSVSAQHSMSCVVVLCCLVLSCVVVYCVILSLFCAILPYCLFSSCGVLSCLTLPYLTLP